jgi:hypothetical protein
MLLGAAIAGVCMLLGWILGLTGYQVGLEEGRKATTQQPKQSKP